MDHIMISDAAKEVQVETHVLRYWEEELKLPIQRNKQGHRCYTKEDVDRFKKIKYMKEQGLQLKAIRTAIDTAEEPAADTKVPGEKKEIPKVEKQTGKQPQGEYAILPKIFIQPEKSSPQPLSNDMKEDKALRLQFLLKQMIAETVREANEELCDNVKQSVLKELDYQFRMQEEREEARDKERNERDEAYYKRMDELLRMKSKRGRRGFLFGKEKTAKATEEDEKTAKATE